MGRPGLTMAGHLLGLVTSVVTLSIAGGAPPTCCTSKTVGGVDYVLRKEGDTTKYDCVSSCIYEKTQEPGPLFCFAAGDLEVVCEDPPGEEGGGSGGGGPDDGGSEGGSGGGPDDGGSGGGSGGGPDDGGSGGGSGGGSDGGSGGGAPGECPPYADDHTMTIYPGPAAQGGKDLILQRHNELRQKVAAGQEEGQPGASNMRKMVWNDELATIAQRWADQCRSGHDKNRDLCDGTVVGQNAYQFWETVKRDEAHFEVKTDESANSWYSEVSDPGFSSADIKPYVFGHGIGHYTQVVWAETDHLGCGMVYYDDGESDGWHWYVQGVVCNYGKSGNWVGGVMYETGEKCSKRPDGQSCDSEYDALCA